jgi:hypothetical protein
MRQIIFVSLAVSVENGVHLGLAFLTRKPDERGCVDEIISFDQSSVLVPSY